MSRRAIAFSCLAAIVVVVLGTRVYLTFERTRLRVVTTPLLAVEPSLAIDVPPDARLRQQHTAIILRVRGTREPLDLSVMLNGHRVARASVPADRNVRIDASVPAWPASPSVITITASRPGWILSYAEVANVHGFSEGLASLVIVPRGRPGDRLLPVWALVPIFVALVVWRPRPGWPAGRIRYLHTVAIGLVLVVFAATLLAPFLTPYAVLLSLDTFLICCAVLYAEPLARAARALTRHALQDVHDYDGRLVPRWRRLFVPPAAAPRVPWWITTLDIVCVIVLVLLVRTWVGREAAITTDPGAPPTLEPWPWLAAALVALLAVRRLSWNIVPWPARVARWVASAWRAESLRAAWPPFVTSRLAVLVTGYVAVFTIGFEGRRPWRAIDNDWLDLYARWDAGWYFQIASRGYPSHFNPARESEIAFFPGLPLLMRGGSLLLDISPWLAGILVVVVAFLCALAYVYRLARLDLPADQARASLMFLAFYPFAFCYSAILTESVFLLAAAGAFYCFRTKALWMSGLFGLLAGLLRPNGFLLAIPLGLIALIPFARSRGWLSGRPASTGMPWPALARQLAAASLPVVGMAAYAAYVGSITGDPLSWIDAQQAWGRATAEGLNVAEARRAMIETQGLSAYARSYTVEMIEAAAAVFALGAVWPIVRRFGLPYGVFVLLCVLPPLISMGSVSLGRYTAPLFPIFLWLGAAVPPERRPYWFALFAAGQALLAVLFFTWRPPY